MTASVGDELVPGRINGDFVPDRFVGGFVHAQFGGEPVHGKVTTGTHMSRGKHETVLPCRVHMWCTPTMTTAQKFSGDRCGDDPEKDVMTTQYATCATSCCSILCNSRPQAAAHRPPFQRTTTYAGRAVLRTAWCPPSSRQQRAAAATSRSTQRHQSLRCSTGPETSSCGSVPRTCM